MRSRRIASTARAMAMTMVAAGTLASAPALAWQHAWRDLTGTVTDAHHEPLRGAVIQVRNEANDSVMSYITGRTGRYTFKRLDANTDYDLSATYKGHKSKTRELSHFETKPSKVIDLKIRLE